MAIRTKEECWMTSLPGSRWDEICVSVPIIDWLIYPQNPKLSTSNNVTSFVQNIQVPELQYIYPTYTGFKFVVTFMNSSSVDWFSVSGAKLNNGVLSILAGQNTDVTYTFKNLDQLDLGITQINVRVKAYGIKNGVETELPNEFIDGIIEMSKKDESGSMFSTNKETYSLSFNKANNKLSGDKEIIVYSKNNVGWENQPFGLTVNKVDNSSTTSLFLSLAQTTIIVGNYTERMLIKAEGKQKYVNVKLEVINDASQFYLSPTTFDFTLQSHENLSSSGVIDVDNQNGLTLSVKSFPTFLESCVLAGNKINFTSKTASVLGVGLFSGEIKVISGSVEKSVFVKINVVEHVINDFVSASYFFALDKKKVQINRVNVNAVKVYMKLDMFFYGYGSAYNETQEYQLPYFQNSAIFHPGEEVNDFFVKQREVINFPKSLDAYQFAIVKMTFSEVDAADNVLDSIVIDNIKFVPGYQPKCFPFFTDFPTRRIYPNSQLNISVDALNKATEIQKLLTTIGETVKPGNIVRTYNFSSGLFNNQVFDLGPIQYLPITESHTNVVNIYFETHNLIFDWFSCVADFELPSDFEHTISENVKSGSEEKFDTKQTDTLTLNTGWLLYEEVEVIDAIFNSNFVLIQLPHKLVKAIPTTKKNALGGSVKGFRSMILEFKIIADER